MLELVTKCEILAIILSSTLTNSLVMRIAKFTTSLKILLLEVLWLSDKK